MRARLSWIGAIPHVVITLLMILVIVDMLVGVFLRYVMTRVSAAFDLATTQFFCVDEVVEDITERTAPVLCLSVSWGAPPPGGSWSYTSCRPSEPRSER